MYNCGGNPNNVTVVSNEKHANWVVYSVFGDVEKGKLKYKMRTQSLNGQTDRQTLLWYLTGK